MPPSRAPENTSHERVHFLVQPNWRAMGLGVLDGHTFHLSFQDETGANRPVYLMLGVPAIDNIRVNTPNWNTLFPDAAAPGLRRAPTDQERDELFQSIFEQMALSAQAAGYKLASNNRSAWFNQVAPIGAPGFFQLEESQLFLSRSNANPRVNDATNRFEEPGYIDQFGQWALDSVDGQRGSLRNRALEALSTNINQLEPVLERLNLVEAAEGLWNSGERRVDVERQLRLQLNGELEDRFQVDELVRLATERGFEHADMQTRAEAIIQHLNLGEDVGRAVAGIEDPHRRVAAVNRLLRNLGRRQGWVERELEALRHALDPDNPLGHLRIREVNAPTPSRFWRNVGIAGAVGVVGAAAGAYGAAKVVGAGGSLVANESMVLWNRGGKLATTVVKTAVDVPLGALRAGFRVGEGFYKGAKQGLESAPTFALAESGWRRMLNPGKYFMNGVSKLGTAAVFSAGGLINGTATGLSDYVAKDLLGTSVSVPTFYDKKELWDPNGGLFPTIKDAASLGYGLVRPYKANAADYPQPEVENAVDEAGNPAPASKSLWERLTPGKLGNIGDIVSSVKSAGALLVAYRAGKVTSAEIENFLENTADVLNWELAQTLSYPLTKTLEALLNIRAKREPQEIQAEIDSIGVGIAQIQPEDDGTFPAAEEFCAKFNRAEMLRAFSRLTSRQAYDESMRSPEGRAEVRKQLERLFGDTSGFTAAQMKGEAMELLRQLNTTQNGSVIQRVRFADAKADGVHQFLVGVLRNVHNWATTERMQNLHTEQAEPLVVDYSNVGAQVEALNEEGERNRFFTTFAPAQFERHFGVLTDGDVLDQAIESDPNQVQELLHSLLGVNGAIPPARLAARLLELRYQAGILARPPATAVAVLRTPQAQQNRARFAAALVNIEGVLTTPVLNLATGEQPRIERLFRPLPTTNVEYARLGAIMENIVDQGQAAAFLRNFNPVRFRSHFRGLLNGPGVQRALEHPANKAALVQKVGELLGLEGQTIHLAELRQVLGLFQTQISSHFTGGHALAASAAAFNACLGAVDAALSPSHTLNGSNLPLIEHLTSQAEAPMVLEYGTLGKQIAGLTTGTQHARFENAYDARTFESHYGVLYDPADLDVILSGNEAGRNGLKSTLLSCLGLDPTAVLTAVQLVRRINFLQGRLIAGGPIPASLVPLDTALGSIQTAFLGMPTGGSRTRLDELFRPLEAREIKYEQFGMEISRCTTNSAKEAFLRGFNTLAFDTYFADLNPSNIDAVLAAALLPLNVNNQSQYNARQKEKEKLQGLLNNLLGLKASSYTNVTLTTRINLLTSSLGTPPAGTAALAGTLATQHIAITTALSAIVTGLSGTRATATSSRIEELTA
jgi:hypothetical protein